MWALPTEDKNSHSPSSRPGRRRINCLHSILDTIKEVTTRVWKRFSSSTKPSAHSAQPEEELSTVPVQLEEMRDSVRPGMG